MDALPPTATFDFNSTARQVKRLSSSAHHDGTVLIIILTRKVKLTPQLNKLLKLNRASPKKVYASNGARVQA